MENITSTSSAHTTGPWHVEQCGDLLVTQVRGPTICELDPQPEATANARLISAAPDLLVCTDYLLRVCNDRLSILAEEDDPDEEIVWHYSLLKRDAERALTKALAI